MVVQKEASIELINTIDERAKLLEKTGLDYLIIHPFSKVFSKMTALEFVRDVLVNTLNISKLIIGYDHHFGKNREGNIEQLTEYSHLYDFMVEEIPAQDIDDVSVSSTKIRRALATGNLKTANNYLGYNFMLNGTVVNGKKLGGKIGYPTANINVKETYKLIPKTGVYVVKSSIENTTVFGMMNIGNRPTISGKHQTIEVHFFDFNQDVYHQNLTIELLYFLRDEEKFDSIEILILQLKKDEETARDYLKNPL
jgi:riboflavin kinase/FMN adenylyltransferase